MVNIAVKQELNQVHLLRAFAALSVTIYHLSLGNPALFVGSSFLKHVVSFGHLGVQIFFVLSGFIICYAMPKNYDFINYKSFLFKRFLRIYPPYLISIFLVLLLNYISHSITGITSQFEIANVFANAAFLTNFGVGNYINVVYWTLGIEVQFYLIIAVTFPFIRNRTTLMAYLILILLVSSLTKIDNMDTILPHLTIFGLGISVFFYQIKSLIDWKLFTALSLAILSHIYFFLGMNVMIVSFLSALILLFFNKKNNLILFLSNISFSLYLIHVIVGGKVINLGLRFVETTVEKFVLLLSSFAISILTSYIFYMLVEKPAISWSKSIRYATKD